MCGLVGALAKRNVMPMLVDSLKRLEYRGYDSAGLAFLDELNSVGVHRCVGKVRDLEQRLDGLTVSSPIGIAHTRWATHGMPHERNAHPHISSGVAVVHNGIIENHQELRRELVEQGYQFESDTDTETIVHLVHHHMQDGISLFEAVRRAVGRLQGSYAIAVMAEGEPETLVSARRHSPLVIGLCDDECFVASDTTALAALTNRFIYLQEGDVVEIKHGSITIVDAEGLTTRRPERRLRAQDIASDKGQYRHYMLKEIYEQPDVLRALAEKAQQNHQLSASAMGLDERMLTAARAVHMVACGTSSHAAEVGRYWMEAHARMPCSVDLASEYRYRMPVVPDDCLFITLSQSGETADTVAALRHARNEPYLGRLAICNVAESSLTRESDGALLTQAGPEIGVASTKAFTSQLLSLLMLTALLARQRGAREVETQAMARMNELSSQIRQVLALSGTIEALAGQFMDDQHALFLGRGSCYPIAKEGALKLKEISYIHAEAYAAGELKHGPLALVDARMPVIVLAPSDGWLEKVKSNMEEVRARGGRLYVFTDAASGIEASSNTQVVRLPASSTWTAPILYSVALQLLAYHVAHQKGTDVDQPRNLAKSVTVE